MLHMVDFAHKNNSMALTYIDFIANLRGLNIENSDHNTLGIEYSYLIFLL
jgi:hypothetical protein